MPLGRVVGLEAGHIALDWDPAAPPQKVHNPQFSDHVCCGQTAGWIKMPFGTEVGFGPDHIVLDGDRAPRPRNGHSSPPLLGFSDDKPRPMSIVAKRRDGSG